VISFLGGINGMGVPDPKENWTFMVQLANSQPALMNNKPMIVLSRPQTNLGRESHGSRYQDPVMMTNGTMIQKRMPPKTITTSL
jgi:hypothetical protein